MNMETLEFMIYPDGRVKEMVTGVVGSSCQEVTAAIEAQLGKIVSQEITADYYATVPDQFLKVGQSADCHDW